MKVLVIGLGQMGLPIALNLRKAGHQVIGIDVSPERRAEFESAGGEAQDAIPRQSDADAALTILASGAQVRAVYEGDRGLITNMRQGSLLVDCSTIDIATARDLQAAATQAGHDMIDAPVSGGVAAAAAGSLSIMIGGTEQAFARARPLLAGIGQKIVHVGGAGAGLAAKLCNNLVVGATIGALSEAFALGERLGVAADTLFEIMMASTGRSWALENVCPAPGPVPGAPSSNGYRPGGKTTILLKDLDLAAQAARDAGVDAAINAAAADLYRRFSAAGGGDIDCTGVFTLLSGRLPPA
ncbi:3-hydroxyisobutyrate dehydrogenase [Terrarubrum flagellatum]|uniref:3-hydroxyisobutyrate dehydrogenase n=1 Tax=Terrirubrum flagellatum TaxID=2895980 RepID=UPI0031450303